MTMPRQTDPFSTSVSRRPTTLSARAADMLANGPLDAVTLMRHVCQVERLHDDAAERMAVALLSSHSQFVCLPSGHWALLDDLGALVPRAKAPAPIGVGTHVASPSLSDIAFAVVDVETTGTRASHGDRVTEIAIADVRDGAVCEVFTQLVNPERMIPAHITSLTQISWAMVKDQPAFRQIATDVTSRLAGRVFTAHNATFDWRFVTEELARGVGVQLSGPRLCTVRMARVLLPQLSRRSLDHVTQYFGINIGARHRAAGDAVATAEVLLRLLRVASDLGLCTWSELQSYLATRRNGRGATASDRRRRAFPHPVREDHSA